MFCFVNYLSQNRFRVGSSNSDVRVKDEIRTLSEALENARAEAKAEMAEAMKFAEKQKEKAIEKAVSQALEEAAKPAEVDASDPEAEDTDKKSSEEDS